MRQGWDEIIGSDGAFVGMTGFGASAPYKDLYKHFGITAEKVAEAALSKLGKGLNSGRQALSTGYMLPRSGVRQGRERHGGE